MRLERSDEERSGRSGRRAPSHCRGGRGAARTKICEGLVLRALIDSGGATWQCAQVGDPCRRPPPAVRLSEPFSETGSRAGPDRQTDRQTDGRTGPDGKEQGRSASNRMLACFYGGTGRAEHSLARATASKQARTRTDRTRQSSEGRQARKRVGHPHPDKQRGWEQNASSIARQRHQPRPPTNHAAGVVAISIPVCPD